MGSGLKVFSVVIRRSILCMGRLSDFHYSPIRLAVSKSSHEFNVILSLQLAERRVWFACEVSPGVILRVETDQGCILLLIQYETGSAGNEECSCARSCLLPDLRGFARYRKKKPDQIGHEPKQVKLLRR